MTERRERFLAGVEQDDPHRRRVERAEVVAQAARSASSRTCPAISTPVGPAPTTTTVSHSRCSSGVGRGLGHLERAEDPSPELERVVDRLHPGREERELVVAEVRLAGAGGHDQAVVRHLDRLVGGRAAWRCTTRRSRSKPIDLGELHADVGGVRRMWRSGGATCAGRQDPRRDLVQQGLEEVVVPAVEQGHVDGQVAEEAARREPAEAAARRRRRGALTASLQLDRDEPPAGPRR